MSSSSPEIKQKSKSKSKKTKKSISDEFKPIRKKSDEKIRTLVYKNSANIDNTQIDLVMIENKKN